MVVTAETYTTTLVAKKADLDLTMQGLQVAFPQMIFESDQNNGHTFIKAYGKPDEVKHLRAIVKCTIAA